MTKTHGGKLPQMEEYFFEYKDICESDSFDSLHHSIVTFDNGVEWRLLFASNIEVNVNRDIPILNPPKYFIFIALYPDNTMDVIRFDIKEPKYLTGYNETRKFYKDELEWVIEVLSNYYNWEYFLSVYNDIFNYEQNKNETWSMPNYTLLEYETEENHGR